MAHLHLKPWTTQRLAMADLHTGKKSGQMAGTYISDLVTLRKAISLCVDCLPKFNAARNGYVTCKNIPMVGGRCDGCKEDGMERRLFLHHQNMPL